MSELPARLVTALAGRYTLERQLGEGGMATVYLAHDVRHDRKVALKVLRPELAAVVGAERFLAEIRTTASLQHPHILPLFDSGQADGLVFYVMPYVQGESLRDRLDRERQLPVDEAVRIANGVASALQYAHEQGVIHRDIKPANILLSRGEPLVADFGIALAVSQAGGGRITETGLSLGTPHYMSPEQATGEKTLDVRTDVYALGCVLYEMLAGEPPYSGSSARSVLVRILTEEPRRITEIRRTVPPNVEAAVATAIEKLPADRFESADTFSRALRDPGFRHEGAEVGAAVPIGRTAARRSAALVSHGSQTRLFALVALVALTSMAALWGWLRPAPQPVPEPITRSYVEVPGGFTGVGRQLAISRDGSAVVYQGLGTDNVRVLHLRRSHELESRPIPGTEGNVHDARFSPDGQWLAFLRGDSLVKVSMNGGPALLLARRPELQGLSWTVPEWLYFVSADAIHRVPDVGGTSEEILAPDSAGVIYRWPELLPDGEALLFTRSDRMLGTEIRLLELANGEVRTLAAPGSGAHYLPTGHIVYGHPDQALFALAFDLRRHEGIGDPVSVLAPVAVCGGPTQFDVSDNGTAVYREPDPAGNVSEMFLIGTNGSQERVRVDRDVLGGPRFSPDGRRIAYRVETTCGSDLRSDLYVHDLDLGTTVEVTTEGRNFGPMWSLDGKSITYQSVREPRSWATDVFRQPADGSGEAEQLFRLEYAQSPEAWTSDGRLLVWERHPGRGDDLLIFSFVGDSVSVAPYLTADWDEREATLSPDERWIAYTSDETGQWEVYVRPFPDAQGGSRGSRISERGGLEPVWSPDSKTIYYWEGDKLLAASVRTEPRFVVVGRRNVLNEPGRIPNILNDQYHVHPAGDRFVLLRTVGGDTIQATQRFTIAVNWFEELKALTGAPRP